MATLPPIQPRPILCKAPSNNTPPSSSPLLLHPSLSQSSGNSNFFPNSGDFSNNNTQVSLPSIPLSSSEEFLKRLREFHRCRQTTFRCLPTIAGQVVDLQALYTTVVAHGGWDKVNDRQLWSSIASDFGIESSCINGTQALKNIYIRYLYVFEKISHGENIDAHDDDDEDSKRRTVSHLQRVPHSYNYSQHNVSDALRAQHGLFRDFVRRSEYEKLELALLCGFPNELTFTLNTLLLLSSSSSNGASSTPFHLYKCPRLFDTLLRHIGLFLSTTNNSENDVHDHHLKVLFDDVWSQHLNYHMQQFWIQSCSPSIIKELLGIDVKSNYLYDDFNLNADQTQQQTFYEPQQELRIEQILMIVRNLSFDRHNAIYLLDSMRSSTSIAYVFLLLVSYCERKLEIQKYALDIWTNLAAYMHLRTTNNDEARLFRQLLIHMLNGGDEDNEQYQQQDRQKLIRALEIIGNLACAGADNAIYLVDYVDVMVRRLVHVPDILVLVHTLESLYRLTESGEQLCNAILKVQSSTPIINTLIDLLTIEARSFSSQTIKTIKIVEMSSGPVLLPSYHQPPPPPPPQPQSIVVIAATQPSSSSQQQTYAIENTEINKSYYSNNNKLVIPQQNHKPTTVAGLIASGNLLAVATPASNAAPPAIVTNAQSVDKKRKHDSISETIAAVVNGTSSPSPAPPPPKRSRPSRARVHPAPSKNTVVVSPAPPPLRPTSSIEDDTSSMESNSNSNSVQSTLIDLLDRCSSPPPPPPPSDSFESDIRSCLNDLCHRVVMIVDESLPSSIYAQIPSPVFKRKIDEQQSSSSTTTPTSTNKRTTKAKLLEPVTIESVQEQPAKKKRNRSAKKTPTESTSVTVFPKKDEPMEQESPDIKSSVSAPNVVTTTSSSSLATNSFEYLCEWDNCRKNFSTPRAVFHHACSAHVKVSPDYVCLWNGCDRIKRQKWALISHIQERHCSEAAFRQARLKSATTNVVPSTTTIASNTSTNNSTSTSTGTSGYAPDAAWLAVRRHMQISSFDDMTIKNKEGPLTKSIRLTAALILRNIARHSPVGKQNLRQYEQLIANLALEPSEASNALTSCLFELSN